MKRFSTLFLAALLVVFTALTPVSKAEQKQGAPKWIKGKLSGKLTRDMNGAIKFFNDNKAAFKVEDAEKEFIKTKESEDSLGLKHIKLQQVVEGVPVFGNEYYIHFDREGVVYLVNGNYDPEARQYAVSKNLIGAGRALEIAKNQVKFSSLEMPLSAKLYLYKYDDGYVPAYLVRVNFLYPEPGDWFVFVNAYDGSIVNKYNNFKTARPGGGTTTGAPAIGTGKGVLGDTKTFNIFGATGSYSLTDRAELMYSNGGEILTYDANNRTRIPGTIMTDTDTLFSTTREPAGVDAHFYAAEVYNYYLDAFQRNSIDNNYMDIISTVHYGVSYNNAGWTGKQMIYGDGDGITFRPFSAALDVIAHELTHGVTDYEAGLIYQDQSGALNESFSDVFGVIIEKNNWRMGEDCTINGEGIRDVSDPSLFGDPETMSEYVDTTADNGGVHTNSGIPNRAAYNAYVNLGNDFTKLQAIYYRALTTYLTSSSDFLAARAALEQSALDLYGTTERDAISNAFSAVGIN